MGREKKPSVEGRLNAILALLTLWMGAWVISLWAWLLRNPPQIGLGNTEMALGWQAIAGLFAFAIWAIGYGLPRDHGVRHLSAIPIGMSLFVGI